MLTWLPDMPPTVATHWNGSGPDGFGPAWAVPLDTAVLGLGLVALFTAIMLAGTRDGRWGPMMRLLGALSIGVNVLIVVGITWSFGMQRGLADPHDAPGIGLQFLACSAIAIAVGFIGWLVQPNVTTDGREPSRTVEPLHLAAGERAVWVRTTAMNRAGMVVLIASILVLAVGTAVAAATDSTAMWLMLGLTLLLAVLTVTTLVFRVRVDDRGLVARSPLGIPRFHVPIDDVAAVAITNVSPTADFGGWGIRLAPDGAFGIVLGAGEALQITRRNGRRFVVTVDDAATAAALLEALSARTRLEPPR
jgi:amino acid transporter